MKKSVSIRILCLVVASVVLGGAVAFAAVMGSPYETLKRAVLDAVTYRNATVESSVTITVNGVIDDEQKAHYIVGDNAVIDYYSNEDDEEERFVYHTNGLNINSGYILEDGVEWYSCNISPREASYSMFSNGPLSMFSPEDRDSAQMRFMELLLDVLVGDLKNNVTMSSGDGVRHIRGTLTESQVPELVKAGLDMIIEQSNGYSPSNTKDISFDGREYVYESSYIERDVKTVTRYKQAVRLMTPEEEEALENHTFYDNIRGDFWGFTDIDGLRYINDGPAEFVSEYEVPVTQADYMDFDPMEMPMKNLTINYVHGEAEVDSDGNLLNLSVDGAATVTDIFGGVNKIEINLTASFSDIGSSNPVCPIPGAEQLLTPEYAKTHFGNEYCYVYFTLNEDGSINTDSITTTYPGEKMGIDMNMSIDMPAMAPVKTILPNGKPFVTTQTQVVFVED